MDSSEGGPSLCSDQEENADGPRNLMSCLAENGGLQLNFCLHEHSI